MEKKQFIAMTADRPTAEALRELARRETDGNVSMVLRRIVRDAAERAGVASFAESAAGAESDKGR